MSRVQSLAAPTRFLARLLSATGLVVRLMGTTSLVMLLVGATPALADASLAGSVEAELDGRRVVLPLLRTDVVADVQGDLANVRVRQTFANPLTVPVHARYLFPLSRDAAVHRMEMQVGDEVVRARIEEVHRAEQTFAQAKAEGKAAALLKQLRPNMFTQQIANLMPGLPIQVEIEYAQTVPRVDGRYQLVIPLVVGPRFEPPASGAVPALATVSDALPSASGWQVAPLPPYPEVFGLTIPDSVDAERVSLEVTLEGGMPVADVESPTHALNITAPDPSARKITLAGGRVRDNRDFVLDYDLAGERTQAGMLAHYDDRGGFFSLLIEPPLAPEEVDVHPREMVFLLDCSGSMNGLPMAASKAFMRRALAALRPTDSFRIIRFSDSATEFSTAPLPATPGNVQRGLDYTERLAGYGGTMMTSGIVQALGAAPPAGALRIVVFLTDGYIGNELEVLSLVERRLGAARLYAFGVGTSVNRYLLSELGRVGRGFTRYMDPTEDVDTVTQDLAERLESPVLTDIAVDWGGIEPTDVFPSRIPDLFAGDSIRIQGRYAAPGSHRLTVRGQLRGRPAELPLEIVLPGPGESSGGAAVPLLWARSAVADAMHQLITPGPRRPAGVGDDDIRARITALGLEYALVTRWTSFVAVSERIYNADPEHSAALDVPLPMVEGVSALAYPAAPAFGGYAAPEAGAWSSFAALALVLGLAAWRRCKTAARRLTAWR